MFFPILICGSSKIFRGCGRFAMDMSFLNLGPYTIASMKKVEANYNLTINPTSLLCLLF